MPAQIREATAPRFLPALDDANRAFWTGGADGRLMVPRCEACARWALPPTSACPTCGAALRAEPASGRATLYTWTLNAHSFNPDVPIPYLVAIVTLDEQDDLRLATNLVDCEEGDLAAGMALEVVFERQGDYYYPLFAPAAGR